MLSLQELQFAQRYPFTSLARRVVKEANLGLEDLPEEVMVRAREMVAGCIKGKYAPSIRDSQSILRTEVLAFPVAKILVSLMNRQEFYQRFAKTFSDTYFSALKAERDEALLDLASEFNVKYSLPESKAFFACLALFDYLKTTFSEDFMKLCNQRIAKGVIYLTRNDFARLLSRLAFTQLLASLPVSVDGVPAKLKAEAKALLAQLDTARFKFAGPEFGAGSLGTINPSLFPPCMANLYSQLLSGVDVPHFGRFDIATFLLAIGLPAQAVMDLFKHAPDYDERVTRYQVERLAGQKGGTKYSPPNCEKVKAHGFCPLPSCGVKHPLTYYKREMLQAAREAKAKPPKP